MKMNKLEENVELFIKTKENRYFSEIHKALRQQLFAFIRKTITDNDTAHEILSNTFERIFVGLSDGKYIKQDGVKFSTWAHSCTLNAIRYYLRYYSKTLQQDTLQECYGGYYHIDDDTETIHQTKVKVHKEIIHYINNDLTDKNDLRSIAKMFYLEGEKLKDIADNLGYSLDNVKYRISKIKENIRKNVKYNLKNN
jgi:RNA polymerase sigma factor (sigma-70 family)